MAVTGTPAVRAVVSHARAEAACASRIDLQHLFLGLMADERTTSARALLHLGVDLPRLRTDLRGGAPGPRDALATAGIDLDEVRRAVEAAFGPGALERADRLDARSGRRHRLTRAAGRTLKRARIQARMMGDNAVDTEHLLLALLFQVDRAPTDPVEKALRRADLLSSAVHGAVIEVRRRGWPGPGPDAGSPTRFDPPGPRGRAPALSR